MATEGLQNSLLYRHSPPRFPAQSDFLDIYPAILVTHNSWTSFKSTSSDNTKLGWASDSSSLPDPLSLPTSCPDLNISCNAPVASLQKYQINWQSVGFVWFSSKINLYKTVWASFCLLFVSYSRKNNSELCNKTWQLECSHEINNNHHHPPNSMNNNERAETRK